VVCGSSPDVVTCAVTNVGTMPEGTAASLFTPFAQSAAATRGTGLGLYIVDQIVRAHGGGVEGRSADGATTFVVRVPRHVRRGTAPAPTPALSSSGN
jgi:two-component system sensor histidine kinase/response regulator